MIYLICSLGKFLKPGCTDSLKSTSLSGKLLSNLTCFLLIGGLWMVILGSCSEVEKPAAREFDSDSVQKFFKEVNDRFQLDKSDQDYIKFRDGLIGRSSEPCIAPPPLPDEVCFTENIVRTITLPPNNWCPSCTTALIAFRVRVCYTPPFFNNLRFTFWDFGMVPTGLDCNQCMLFLPGDALEAMLDWMTFQASLIAEVDYITPWVQFYRPLCPNNYFSSDFIRTHCYRWCHNLITNQITQLVCGNKCCQRTRTFCWLPVGTVDISSPVYQEIGGNTCNATTDPCNGLPLPCYDKPCGNP